MQYTGGDSTVKELQVSIHLKMALTIKESAA